jgi:enoyl-[acyl-carrier protein] reductase III
MFDEIDARAGALDFLVANASAGMFGPLSEMDAEMWDRSFRTNVVALHQGALLAAERMRRRGGGRIVALSSIGTRFCFDWFGMLGPIKAAVEALVGYLAVELAADNVQVGAVAAGAVEGDLLRHYPGRPRWENLVPSRRLTTEEEVADAIVFLLTTSGMNGATLVVDAAGGLRTCEPVSVGTP